MASTTSTTVLAQRSCRRRRIKCIGNDIPQKKGPKASRDKVLFELRENQRNAQLGTVFPPEPGLDRRTPSSTSTCTPGLLAPALVKSCLEFFFANVCPSQPVLHEQRAQEAVVNMERSTEAYCMIVALCAYVMIEANMKASPSVLLRPAMAQKSNFLRGLLWFVRGTKFIPNTTTHDTSTVLGKIPSWTWESVVYETVVNDYSSQD
ncbi:hypothetical protein BKA66DRAFT_438421 [Pyrenochaeta sp. MPI-SDFR-AT-0127]|nr:hypothetical protein BKA66DRAFT_438421 [Pyrenochaeta sp. MPI-SDFR-AT-0127]